MQQLIILSDFNGTISLMDLAEFTLKTFVKEDWRQYDKLFLEGKLSLEKAIITQYSFLKTPKDEILKEIDKVSSLRENFADLINYCSNKNIDFIIITSGLDFVINHILKKNYLSITVKLVSVQTVFNEDHSLQIKAPERFDLTIKDFKLDHVEHYKKLGYNVIYIGDSHSDFQAVLGADLTFAVQGSKLAGYCLEQKIKFEEFENFTQIKNSIQKKFFS